MTSVARFAEYRHENSGAVFSPDHVYRYALWRCWGPDGLDAPPFVVVGLNPSTADAKVNDATVRRLIAFARRESYRRLVVLNLFAFRATDPKDLVRASVDIVGEHNDAVMRSYARQLGDAPAIAAWGAFPAPERVAAVCSMFPRLLCFGRNRNGTPKHPLYVHSDQPLVPYG